MDPGSKKKQQKYKKNILFQKTLPLIYMNNKLLNKNNKNKVGIFFEFSSDPDPLLPDPDPDQNDKDPQNCES